MTLSDLPVDRNRLAELCRRYRVARLEVMGSFARGDAGPESDLDILVTFEPSARIGLEFVELQQELEALFGRPVDLLTRASVEGSPNKYFRRYALRSTELLYEPA
jgi:predicted nucleotidyltransferase